MFYSLVLLAALSFTAYSQPVGQVEKHRVIIVGAGVSGFAAAVNLLENNVTDFILLEASDRIGGRIHTIQFGGVTIDRGAEYVHGEKDNTVFELANPHNLLVSSAPLHDVSVMAFYNISGEVVNATYFRSLVDKAYAILFEEGIKHFNGSMDDYFTPRFNDLLSANNVEPPIGEAIRHLVPLLEGAYMGSENLTHLGAWGQSNYWENEGDLDLKWKPSGNGFSTVFDLLSKKFPNPEQELPVANMTLFNKQVTRVEQKNGHVVVTCTDGSTYHANHVIVTVSLGVLKKHAADIFQPALPERKSAAIDTLGFGCVDKAMLLFPRKWWPDDIKVFVPLFSQHDLQVFQNSTEHGSWSSYNYGFNTIMNQDRILCAWFSGKSCRIENTLTDKQVTDGLMEVLQKVLGKKYDIPKPENIFRSNWAINPYTLGAYSYRTVDSDRLNITNDDLAEPVMTGDKPVILFAGEATHPHYSSTVHGALDSGRREASRLINYFENQQQTNCPSEGIQIPRVG